MLLEHASQKKMNCKAAQCQVFFFHQLVVVQVSPMMFRFQATKHATHLQRDMITNKREPQVTEAPCKREEKAVGGSFV